MISLFMIYFKRLLQYRIAALAGIGTQIFWGVIKVMILEAFYLQSVGKEPISFSQATLFIWFGQAFLQLLPWNIDKEIEREIRQGNVVYYLLRPVPLYVIWFIRALSMRLAPALLRFFPVLLCAFLIGQLPFPSSASQLMVFLFSILLGALVGAAITTLVMISLFRTLSGEGIQRLIPHVTLLFSGLFVPLPLFPDSFQGFLNLQPFRCIIDIPSRIYAGVIPEALWMKHLLFQLGWLFLLMLLGIAMMQKATKKLVIQGG